MRKQFLTSPKTARILLSVLVFVFLAFLVFFGYNIDKYANLQMGREAVAAGGFPYQIGLTGVSIMACECSGVGCTNCSGGNLCTFDNPPCLRSTVSGSPSGGTSNIALIQDVMINMAGVSQGGQLIAGGMGPTTMDGGVLAGQGGCVGSGCTAMAEDQNFWEKTKLALKYFITGFKE